MLLKLTFLLQFRRVFPLPAFQRLCDMFMIFLAAWTVAGIVGGVAICLPFEKNWDPQDRAWLCEKRFWFWLGHGIVHVVTDVVLCIMPLPLLRTLPLPPVQKVVLIGIFCLGFVYVLLLAYGDLWLGKASNLGDSTCVISAVRLTTLHASLQDEDFSWASAKTVFWSVGEVTCSIVCLCIPTLRPLLGRRCCPCLSREGATVDRATNQFRSCAISLPSTVGPRAPTPTRHPTNGSRGGLVV